MKKIISQLRTLSPLRQLEWIMFFFLGFSVVALVIVVIIVAIIRTKNGL